MRLDHLKEFIYLARTLNYSSAARQLNISQSALSNHIIALEKHVGTTLVNRRAPLSLTPAGRTFLTYAQEILELCDVARRKSREVAGDVEGTVRVLLPPLAGTTFSSLIELIREFESSHPNVRFDIWSNPELDTHEALRSQTVDCSLLTQHPVPLPDNMFPGLDVVAFCTEEAAAWVDKKVFPPADGPVPMAELAKISLVVHSNSHAVVTEESIRSDFDQVGLNPTIELRYARSNDELLLSVKGEGEAILKPKGYFDSPVVSLRTDRVVRPLEPPLYVTSFLGFRMPAEGEPNHDAVLSFENYVREHAPVSKAP